MRYGSHSMRFRLTVWYAVVLGVFLGAFTAAVYGFMRLRLSQQLEDNLEWQYDVVARALREEADAEELGELEDLGLAGFFEVQEDGLSLYRSRGWAAAGLGWPAEAGANLPAQSGESGQEPWRVLRGGVESAGRQFEVVVAVSARGMRDTLNTLVGIMAVDLPIALFVAVLGGWWLAGRALAPVAAMAARAREINADSLAQRLPVTNPHDEIGHLATVFNEVLGRLEDAFQRLRAFTADASHELRTPLTALRSVGEVALQGSPDAALCRDAIGSMLEEADRLVALLDSLLVLTRADADRAVVVKADCDLALMAREVVDLLRVLADEKEQTLSISANDATWVHADQRLLRQAVLNLVDNALKFTPPRGHIRVAVHAAGSESAILEVCDSGPGIAPELHERVFERFYRADSARSTNRGAGLGLAIARWAVVANGGRIELDSAVGQGSVFRIVLPAAQGERT